MHFTLVTSLLAFALSAAPAFAADYRQLYNITGGDGVAFCKTWKCNCINYTPKTDLNFQTAYCQPGNYQGQNKDTQALAFCTFTNSGNKVVTVNKHVSSESGATLA